jgi:hypothetical protein
MKRLKILPASILILSLLACSLPGFVTPTPVTPLPEVTEPSPDFDLSLLGNATYMLEGCDGSLQAFPLTNGSYASGPDPMAVGYTSVTLGDQLALGDLNFDGANDAAVILGVNCGGTGVFTYIAAVLNSGGVPLMAASVFIDDRPMIDNLAISSGEILADILVHGPDDPMCCPALQTQQGYRLYASQLVLSRMARQTPGGSMRAINITSAADLSVAAYPLTVSGSTTIGPFENTLGYNIYTEDNTLVTGGSVMTDSPNPGDPGNFSLTTDLSLAGVFGRVRIEFIEYSMADGSILALDSVLLDVH